MKNNELHGFMILIVGIMLAFSLTACDDGDGTSGGGGGGNPLPRELTIAMWDSYGDGWDNDAALRINVNGTNRAENARLANGGGPEYYKFTVNSGAIVQFFWVSGGSADSECAFAVYYSNDPPNPMFNPSTGTTGGKVLVSKRYDNPSGTVGNGTSMGSFTVGSGTGGGGGGGGGDTSSNVYVGVVTFNSTINTSNISNNLGTAKTFISNSTNNVDATALCYAVSKAVTMFALEGLPAFDNTFIVTFTDGADNRSSSLYVADGKSVTQTGVYNQAKTDLATRPALRSYAIGFTGNEAINQTSMEQLVQNGLYRTASNESQLNSVFQGIADSVLASSKNVTLQTNIGLFTEAEPKYFRLTITARRDLNSSYGQVTDTIYGKLVYNMGQPGAVPVFTVTQQGYCTLFDNPINGTVNSGKILLPFTNLKFVYYETDYFITTIKVEVSYDNYDFREDTEDSSAAEDISKTIGVVLVIDCSQSLGTAFSSVKTAANNFIDTLAAR